MYKVMYLVKQSWSVVRVNFGQIMRLQLSLDLRESDGVGFEPTVGFHLRRFSRPVP